MVDVQVRTAIPELDIHAMPGHLIRRMQQASVAIFDGQLRAAGIDLTPVQFAALVMLERNPGVDQASLAQGISYDRVTIGGVLDRLEAKALVRREADPGDRRARRVFLEPAGVQLLTEARPIVRHVQGLILAGLDEQEARQLVSLLGKALIAVGDASRTPTRTRT